jgi:hypothetical protein
VISFSGSPFTIPAGTSLNVDVYADILSSPASTTAATTLSSCSGTGLVSYSAITCAASTTGTPTGQNVKVSGQASVTVSVDGSQPSAGQIVMGSTGNTLAIYRFTETSNAESVKITQLPVWDLVNNANNKAAFTNLTLWNGSTLLGTVGSAGASSSITGGTGYTYTFQLQSNPIVVPQANSISITLKGDAAPYSVGATDNGTNTFEVATTTNFTALGLSSNAAATTTFSSAAGNAQTVLRTVLTPSVNNSSADGGYFTPSTHQSRNTTDDLAELKFSANNAGGAALTHLTVSFSGSLASSTGFLNGISLLDSNGTNILSDNANATLATSTVVGIAIASSTATGVVTSTIVINGITIATSSAVASSTTAAAIANAINAAGLTGITAVPTSTTASTVTITSTNGAIYVTATSTNAVGTETETVSNTNENCQVNSTCYATWTIPSSTAQAQITAGGTGLFKLRINDNNGQSATSNISMSLSAAIQSTGDVNYIDSLDASGNVISSIPSNIVPMTIASFALPLGN